MFSDILKLWEQTFFAEKQRTYLMHEKNLFFERNDFMKFKVVGKSLILTDYSHKITEGENSFDTVEIAAPRYHDDCDLSTLSFRFSETSDDGTTTAIQVLSHTKCDEQYIYLKGSVTSDFSAITDKVTFMLTGVNEEKIVAKFQSASFTVGDDISLTSLPNETTSEQIFNQTHLEAEKAIKAAERAEKASKTPAPAEIYPATTEVLGGVKVDGKTITAAADGTISALDNETLKLEISELKAIIGFTDNDIIGLHADFENNIFTRLGAASGKNAGADFDVFSMYGGRKRCNVLDDGTITAYYGDTNFAEDGSNGQVMVYQPKFYYKVVPLKLDTQTEGCGYHLRSANYYISSVPKIGFKLHPAFYDENGKPVDYILLSAYEGCVFDSSANSYLQNDEQVTDFSTDKLSSIAGVKPCSGKSQNLIRKNAEQLAENRGKGWHCHTIKAESANQMLMTIEFAAFNLQEFIDLGVVSIPDNNIDNLAVNTGETAGLGNFTGNADGISGRTSISYRGMENPWGNMYKFIAGINTFMDANGVFHGYLCSNFAFSEDKNTENYNDIGFTFANNDGFVSAFGYDPEYDWLYLVSETQSADCLPVNDYFWCKSTMLNSWRIFRSGGYWYDSLRAGAFSNRPDSGTYAKGRAITGRILYIPANSRIK